MRPPWGTTPRDLFDLPDEALAQVVRGLHRRERATLMDRWRWFAHDGQLAPDGDWRVWLIRAGRGFGKTRAGAEWVTRFARATPGARIALVGATAEDVRRVMIEGASGLLAVARPGEEARWRASAGEIDFHGGATGFVYSAEAPEKLRGPEHGAAWCDELAKWRYGEAAWDNLVMGLRQGGQPRIVVTTTPQPVNLMRRVMALPGTVETRGRTADNPHLSATVKDALEGLYGGTRLGRQELDGELIEEVAGALWHRDVIERQRSDAELIGEDGFVRVLVGVDPPAGTASGTGGDACGIVAVGVRADGHAHVLEDASVVDAGPAAWAAAVAACAARWRADRVVAEANQGGAMVESVLRAADAALPVALVRASRGKAARAEPVAALFDAGRAWLRGRFPALEDELCGLQAGGGYAGPGRSPDRADAMVWAMSEAMLGPRGSAAVRPL